MDTERARRGRLARGLTIAIVVTAAVLTVAQIVLIAVSWNDAAAAAYYWRPAALVQALIAFEFALVGGLISVRRVGNRIGWLVLAAGLSMCIYSFAGEYALRGEVIAPGTLPASDAVAILTQTTWALAFGALPLVLLLYPNGTALSRRWALAMWPAIVGTGIVVIAGTLHLWPYRDQARDLLLAEGDFATSGDYLTAVFAIGTGLLLTSVVPAVAAVVVRWRRSVGIERLQMRWLLPTGMLLIAGSLLNGLLANGSAWGEVALLSALFALPASIGFAVLRYRLYDIDRVISRVLSYAIVTGLLAAIYGAVVIVPSMVLPLDSNVLVAGATLAAAAAFVPVRRRVQRGVDRRFNRAHFDAAMVVERFKNDTRNHVDLDGLAADLRGALTLTVQPTATTIWIRDSG